MLFLCLVSLALQIQKIINQEQTTQQGAVKVLFVAMVGAAPKIWAIAQEMTKFAVLLGGSCVEVVRSRNVAPVLTAPLAIITAQVLMAMNVLRSRNSHVFIFITPDRQTLYVVKTIGNERVYYVSFTFPLNSVESTIQVHAIKGGSTWRSTYRL